MSISTRPGRLCSAQAAAFPAWRLIYGARPRLQTEMKTELFRESRSLKRLNAAAFRGISPRRRRHRQLCSHSLNPLLSRVEGPEQVPGDYFPRLQASFFPSSSAFPPSELKQRLCSPHERTRREAMGKLFQRGPWVLCFFNLQGSGAGAQERECCGIGTNQRERRATFSAFREEFETSLLEATSLVFFQGAYKEEGRY